MHCHSIGHSVISTSFDIMLGISCIKTFQKVYLQISAWNVSVKYLPAPPVWSLEKKLMMQQELGKNSRANRERVILCGQMASWGNAGKSKQVRQALSLQCQLSVDTFTSHTASAVQHAGDQGMKKMGQSYHPMNQLNQGIIHHKKCMLLCSKSASF